MNSRVLIVAVATASCLIAAPALAHTGMSTNGLVTGLLHPMTGADHLLAAILVGLWAAQLGGRAAWVLPSIFVAVMIGGAVTGMAGLQVAGLEAMAIFSVVLLGGAFVWGVKPAALVSILATGVFAVVHGTLHGMEAASITAGWDFLFGILTTTTLLLAVGAVAHAGLRRTAKADSSQPIVITTKFGVP